MTTFRAFDEYFQCLVHSTALKADYENIRASLKRLKEQAVQANDQTLAKTIWCFERVTLVNFTFVTAFQKMKEKYFYDAWCALEDVELGLFSLENHYCIYDEKGDPYRLQLIAKLTKQFQDLYPYVWFISPAMLIKQKICSVCQKPISVRNPCGHIVGEIYNGERCVREITEFDMLEVSTVKNPVQKYSVMFLHHETDETIDNYNYSHVDYVIRGLRQPFDDWDAEWIDIFRPRDPDDNLRRNDLCPCGSGKKYKKCCLKKPGIAAKHLQVTFSIKPPDDLPGTEHGKFVGGIFSLPEKE